MRPCGKAILGLLAVLGLAACSGPAGSAKERLVLDPTFGHGGVALAADAGVAGGADFGLALVRDPDGGLLLAGIACDVADPVCTESHWAAAAWRFLPSGGLDGGFGRSGLYFANGVAGSDLEAVFGAAAVPGGYLLAGAVQTQTAPLDLDAYLWALDPYGRAHPDLLGGTGSADYDGAIVGGGLEFFSTLWVQGESLWLAGAASRSAGAPDYRVTVWKLDKDGNADASFHPRGVWSSARRERSWAHALVLDGEGRPVVVGQGGDTGQVWRLAAAGGLDPGFGGGRVTLQGATTIARAVLLDGERIVVGGLLETPEGWRAAIWRLNPDGTPDSAFGTQGLAVLPGATQKPTGYGRWYSAQGLTRDEEGRYLLTGGVKGEGGDLDAAVWRVLPDGREDPNFCQGGPCTFDRAGGDDWATALVLGEGGRLFLGGWSTGPDGDADATLWGLELR